MRHRKSFNHLGRTAGHRKAMMANMAASLILHKRIKTTTAKAKALRMYVEPLITKSKNDSTHARRLVFEVLQNKEAVTELFREVSPKIAERAGGYTRILKTGTRLGDNADMCIIELVDYNDNLLAAKEEVAAKSGRRRRRGGKKKDITEQVPVAGYAETPVTKANEAVEAPVTEEPLTEEIKEETITDEVADETPVENAGDATDEIKAQEEEDTEEKKVE
jgi:large subunit ribosomal protein L17